MFKIIAVTASELSSQPLDIQIKRVAQIEKPNIVILREKKLTPDEYIKLAKSIQAICLANQIDFFCNTNIAEATTIGCKNIQVSFTDFCKKKIELKNFRKIIVSVHSLEEAVEAEKKGAHAIIFGHIFLTDSKKGLPARGIESLTKLCNTLSIPVYAIGGIKPANIHKISEAGAQGACLMSYFMTI